MTAATAALAAWQRRHEGAGGGTLTAAQEKEGKDLKDRLQTLKDLEEKREDLGEHGIAVICTQLVLMMEDGHERRSFPTRLPKVLVLTWRAYKETRLCLLMSLCHAANSSHSQTTSCSLCA